MKVKELIEKLKEFDGELEVMSYVEGEYWFPEPEFMEADPTYISPEHLPKEIQLDDETLSNVKKHGYIELF